MTPVFRQRRDPRPVPGERSENSGCHYHNLNRRKKWRQKLLFDPSPIYKQQSEISSDYPKVGRVIPNAPSSVGRIVSTSRLQNPPTQRILSTKPTAYPDRPRPTFVSFDPFARNHSVIPHLGLTFAPSCVSVPPMPRKIREIVEEASQLPYGERVELIEQLIADTAKDIDPKIEKVWGDEVMRRLADIESGKEKLIPGDEAMARVRKSIGL